jgi:hypothetical protein
MRFCAFGWRRRTVPAARVRRFTRPNLRENVQAMKLVVELLLALILHPVAVILMWINLAGRTDIGRGAKVLWAILGLLWGIGPILYILVGDGTLW